VDDILSTIKEANRIEDVIEETHPLEHRHGKYIRGLGENHALVVNILRQLYVWNGSGGNESGDVFTWVMNRHRLDFKGSWEWLARRAHLPEPRWSHEDQAKREANRKRETAFGLAQAKMAQWLWDDPEALAYARGRGWTDETIREAGLGFSGRNTAAALSDLRGDFSLNGIDPECPHAVAILGWRGDVKAWAKNWGVEIEDQPNWREGGWVPGLVGKTRLIYTHYVNGRVTTFSGRNILGAEVTKEGKEIKSYNLPVVLSGERQVYFNQAYGARADECVVVEGQADAITLGQWGAPAVAMMGTSYQDQEKTLGELRKRHQRLYLGLDADEAGLKALRGRNDEWPMAFLLGPMARVVRWPEGKDANDWLKAMGEDGLLDYQGSLQPLAVSQQGEDELVGRAVELVQKDREINSIAKIQRALKIGYPRAVKVVEALKAMGVVTADPDTQGRLIVSEAAADGERRCDATSLRDETTEGGPGGEEGRSDATPVQDREEYIRRLVELQTERAREALGAALTMAEECAQWAGQLKGGERDEGMKTAFKLISQMDRVERASYRKSLIERLGIGIREFADILKGAVKESEEEPVFFVETLGGFIGGWLIEYVYDPGADKARLAFRDPDKKIGVAEFLDIDGKRYVPKPVNNFIKKGGVLFPSEIGTLKSTKELVTLVEMFINAHYLLENKYLSRIIAYYVLMSWVYDAFNALPYLRAMGEAGAGKSELMRRVGHLCYRLMMASGAGTAASFFRATEMYRGTVFIDEADLHDGGDMSNDLVKFLNLGAMAGNPIWRLEEVIGECGKTYEVMTFETFCPKLIAMRKDFKDDAVGSRCLTIRVQPREPIELKAKGIKLNIDDEFRERARAIRNLLLRWRFEKWEPQIECGEELMDLEVSSRLNQVTMPLKALAKDDPELQREIELFLRAYHREMTLTKSMTIAARVVEALWRIWNNSILHEKYVTPGAGGETVLIGDVALIANQIMDEMNALGEDEEEDEGAKRKRKKDSLTARGVGSLVRNELQLQVGDRRGKGFPVFWDEMRLRALAKRYGVDPEVKTEQVRVNEEKKAAPPVKQEEIPF
jgi:DNA primase